MTIFYMQTVNSDPYSIWVEGFYNGIYLFHLKHHLYSDQHIILQLVYHSDRILVYKHRKYKERNLQFGSVCYYQPPGDATYKITNCIWVLYFTKVSDLTFIVGEIITQIPCEVFITDRCCIN
jgi:hypothetical protein